MKYEEFNLSKNADGLLPVVVQDSETLKVLMVAYMNKEAYEKTCQTGRATFFSRTRGQLWTKGETSGNYIEVVKMYPDCDNDTLLLNYLFYYLPLRFLLNYLFHYLNLLKFLV